MVKKKKRIWNKIWERRENTRKADWISYMGKELEGLKEELKSKFYLDSLRATFKKVSKLKNTML